MNSFDLPKILSVSDFQRRTREVFEEISKSERPSLVMNHNKKLGVFLTFEAYNEMAEMLEDYLDGLELAESVRESKPEDFLSLEEVEAELIKAGKLKPRKNKK